MAWIEGRIPPSAERALQALAGPVKMVYFSPSQDCRRCDDTEALLKELVGLSDHLSLEVHHWGVAEQVAARYAVDKAPALVLIGPAGARVRYHGAPAGLEFAPLVAALREVAAGTAVVAPAARDALADLLEPVPA